MNARAGMFYAVGVGPGNPAWMTREACDVLGFCPVIAAPKNAAGEMAALEVARGAVDLSRKSILPLKFTAARAKSTRKAEYVRAAGSIARVLDAGLSVAMVNLGDVSIYATAYYVLDELRRQGYATQMIPGITSFCAVAATLGTSLTDMDAPLHIYPGETDNLDICICRPADGTRSSSSRPWICKVPTGWIFPSASGSPSPSAGTSCMCSTRRAARTWSSKDRA